MLSFNHIRPLLYTGTNKSSRWFSYIGLGIGVLLLLASIQMYINIQQLLKETNTRKAGYDYISVTKTVTNETMGNAAKNLFTAEEIRELNAQPFIDSAAPLISNQFRVQLSAGNIIPFKTDLFLETVENEFIDTVPPEFSWEIGQQSIPLIISSDFLEIYNVFAPAQGLPQISQETATGVPVVITVYGNGMEQAFNSRIVAFSDRINSVLVPKKFLDWANQTFGEQSDNPGRIYLKLKDANNPDLLTFLDTKNYKINKDKTKFGRVRQVLEGVFTGLGIFGLLVVILALMLFSFYLQLMIARSKDNLQLLLILGYAPSWLSQKVSRQFVPVYVLVVVAAMAATQLMQYAFHKFAMFDRPELQTVCHWSVWAVGIALMLLAIMTNHRMVKKLVYKLY